MLTLSLRRAIAGALLLAPLGGCARTSHVTHLQELNVEVDNNLAPAGPVTIYTQSDDGANERIGTIPAGTKAVLTWVPANRKKSYILIAERAQETPIKSQRFMPDQAVRAMVSWSLTTNTVTFGGGGPRSFE